MWTLCFKQKKTYIAASPDGLVTCECCGNGILEIKCPISVAHLNPSESNLPYLKRAENSDVKLNRNHPYYSQVQHQMGVTGRYWCDFFIYSRHGHYLERILFDPSHWSELDVQKLMLFVPNFRS